MAEKIVPIRAVLCIVGSLVILGSLLSNDPVRELTDMFNNLMVIPNVIAPAALSGLVASEARRKKGKRSKDLTK